MISNYNQPQLQSNTAFMATGAQNALGGAVFGGAIGTIISGMRPGRGIEGYARNLPLMGGGWNNRLVAAGKMGVAESFGFLRTTRTQRAALRSMGLKASRSSFLGWRGVVSEFAGVANKAGINVAAKGGLSKLAKHVSSSPGLWRKGAGALGSRALAGGAIFGFMGYQAYKGYQKGGFGGATEAIAQEIPGAIGFEVGQMAVRSALGGVVGGTVAAGVMTAAGVAMAGVAIGYAGYQGLKYGQQEYRKLRGLEMGGGTFDPFGTKATLRQRSLQAIQRSSINGRTALGNEALLLHGQILR